MRSVETSCSNSAAWSEQSTGRTGQVHIMRVR